MSGIFYVIGTPIGNMGDITLRQLETLKNVDFVCAEDTRVTVKLFNRYEIKKPLVSFHEHSTRGVAEGIISKLLAGESCGIVTDAGMPCISDPGEVLVKMCAENGIDVRVIPGPSAVVSAVAVSGLSTSRFTFEGFLPVQKKQRSERLEKLRGETATMVFYEAPHKLRGTLDDLAEYFGGGRKISICRELTKIHEEVLRFTLDEAVQYYSEHEPKGEFVLVAEGCGELSGSSITIDEALAQVQKLVDMGERPVDACKAVAKESGFKKGELYSAFCE
ncbi:MAG: 16S rRNA (cytidine(1402)-2'-O)-methyltransferase [Ruminococcus sp.]|nr:16S rRNA (cytidine(1402)-2'-O)-methyltransferase [Ruminococcus sp.]